MESFAAARALVVEYLVWLGWGNGVEETDGDFDGGGDGCC
jgi:hypothetical protein